MGVTILASSSIAWMIQYSPAVTQTGETSRGTVCELLGSDSRQLFRLVLAVTLLINCSIR